MIHLRSIYHVARADFAERVRRYSFLVVMGLTVFAAYMFVPPYGSAYTSFVVASHRGYYNSPWVGTLFGVVAVTLLALIGFYFVKNSIARDHSTRVGQIIASTSVSKTDYVLGKWLSNVAVLAAILAVMTVMAPIMQLIRAEDTHLDLLALITPIWMMGLPALALVAALAVLFESIPFLRGGLGNVVYFFLWGPVLMGTTARQLVAGHGGTPFPDFAGVSRTMINIQRQLDAAGIDPNHGTFGVIGPREGAEFMRFWWSGMDWTLPMLLERLAWAGLALAVAMIAAIPFDRFDPARGGLLRLGKRFRPAATAAKVQLDNGNADVAVASNRRVEVRLTPLVQTSAVSSLWTAIMAELRLMLQGRSKWWYLVAAGLVISIPLVPSQLAAQLLFAAASIWPILIWSAMGNREVRFNTHEVIFSIAHPLRRQLPAAWLAGVVVTALTGSGFAIRMMIFGEWQYLSGWIVGVMFVPSLALAMGVWSGGSRLFEIVYLMLWYISKENGATAFDYRGATPEAIASGIPYYYLAISIVLVAMAFAGRFRQLRK